MSRKSKREDEARRVEEDPLYQISQIMENSETLGQFGAWTRWSMLIPSPSWLHSYGIGVARCSVHLKVGVSLRLHLGTIDDSEADVEFNTTTQQHFDKVVAMVKAGSLLWESATHQQTELVLRELGGCFA